MLESAADGGNVLPRLSERDARPEPGYGAESGPRVGRRGEGRGPKLDVRRRRVGRLPAQGKIEAGRHDADHQAGVPVDRNGVADHGAVGVKPAHPQAVAENHDGGVRRLILFGKNVTSEHGRDAQDGEQACAGAHAVERFGSGVRIAGEVEDGVAVDADGLKGARPAGQLAGVVPDHPVTVGLLLHAGVFAAELDQPGGVRIRQRVDQDRLDGRKYHGGGADAQRDGEQSDGGGNGGAAKEAEGQTSVLEDGHPLSILRGLPRIIRHAERV